MRTHASRRKAAGLAALSLGTAGAFVAQVSDAPGTAKEPRPASHFRLVLQGVEGAGIKGEAFLRNGVVEGIHVRNGTLLLGDFRSRQVFSYSAGQRLLGRVNNTYTKAQSDARFLTRTDANAVFLTKAEADAAFLTKVGAGVLLSKPEADATYAKKSDAVAGRGSVLSGKISAPGSGVRILTVPGVGDLEGTFGSAASDSFALKTTSTTPIPVSSSAAGGAGSTSASSPYTGTVLAGIVRTLQLITPAGQIVSLTLSVVGEGASRSMVAQGLVT